MAFSLADILEWTSGRVVNAAELGESAGTVIFEKASSLGEAGPRDVAFFFSKAYQGELLRSNPSVLVTADPFVEPLSKSGLPLWRKTAVISCADPYLAMAIVTEKVAAAISTVAHLPGGTRSLHIHPSAVVDPSAAIGEGVLVSAHCVIEAGARIGPGTTLYPGCFIGPKVVIGRDCVLFPHVTVYEWAEIGNRVRIHASSVIGADGFGYAPRRQGNQVTGHQKIFHLGKVVIGDDVEIGANSCVDRGTFGDTRLEKNVKLDNQVHIGHNASLDEGAVVCGGTCLAGRARVGRYAYVGGLVGIANDVQIGDGASVGALALISKDVPAGGTAVGNPQREFREHFKVHALLNRLLSERRKKDE